MSGKYQRTVKDVEEAGYQASVDTKDLSSKRIVTPVAGMPFGNVIYSIDGGI